MPCPEKEHLVRVQILIEDARILTRCSKFAAGHDLYSIESLSIPAQGRTLIKTGLAIAVPSGTYGRLAPRSGLATKGISVDAGVIDADYRGGLKVLLVNHGSSDYEIKTGDQIAQLIVEKIVHQDWKDVDMLDETDRADKGFSSTGINWIGIERNPTHIMHSLFRRKSRILRHSRYPTSSHPSERTSLNVERHYR